MLQVALPLVVSALSWTVMTFMDRMFLQWESGTAMAAAFSASTVWFMLLCFPLGICTYASTFVSQYFGAERHTQIGPVTWQGVWVGVAFSPLLLLAMPLAPDIFALAAHSAEVVEQEIIYFQILLWGAPAMLIGQSLSSFYSGRGQTQVVMAVDASFAGVNLVLDYLWIFGAAGFPAMGIAGAGWATVVSLWLKAACYAALVLRKRYDEVYATRSGIWPEREMMLRLLRFGGPSGMQMLLDVTGFTVFILLAGRLGSVAAEATSIAFSVSTLAFMPVWGLSLATSILVGQRLGEDRDDLAARATWTTLCVALGYMAVISALYLLTPNLFLYGFLGDAEGDNGGVYPVAINLLKFVAAYNLFDATLMVFAGAIKGAGDMRFILKVSIVMATLLAVLSFMTVEVWKVSIYGCWAAVTSWVMIFGVVVCIRFLGGKWREMRVIEPAV